MADEEEFKAHLISEDHELDRRKEAGLSRDIKGLSGEISFYEEYGTQLQQRDQKSREDLVARLKAEERRVDDERVYLIDLASKVDEYKDNAVDLAKQGSKRVISYWNTPGPFEESITNWFRTALISQPGSVETALFPKNLPLTIYKARIDAFEPFDWERVSDYLQDEAAKRSIAVGVMESKIFPLELVVLKEDFLPSQPTSREIKQLLRELEKTGLERNETRIRMEKRLKYFNENIEKYRNLFKKDGRFTDKEAEMAAGAAASREADRLLKEEELEKLEEKPEKTNRIVSDRVSQSSQEKKEAAPVQEPKRGYRLTGQADTLLVRIRTILANPFGALRRMFTPVRETGEVVEEPQAPIETIERPLVRVSVLERLKGFFGRKQPSDKFAEKTVEEAAKKTIQKKTGEKVTEGAAKGLATKAGLGVISGGVLTALMIAKGIWDNKELREMFLRTSTAAAILLFKLLELLLAHPLALMMGGIGSLLLTPLAPFLGPLAPMGGFAAGFYLGIQMENIFGGILQGSGTASAIGAPSTAASTTATTGVGAGAGMDLGAIASGTGVSSIGFWSIGIGATSVIATSLFSLIALIAGTTIALASMDQTNKTSFEVKLTVDPTEVSTFDGTTSQLLKYSYQITTSGQDDVQITSISSKSSRNTQVGSRNFQNKTDFQTGTISKNSSQSEEYSFSVPANEDFKDSEIVTVITVKGKAKDSEEEEIKTAIAITKLGHPVFSGPYGYPAIGLINSLDREPLKCVNKTNPKDVIGTEVGGGCRSGYRLETHCGTFLNDGSRACIDGGMDIGSNGIVYAPMSGDVVFSKFDRGDPNYHGSTCNPNSLSDNEFCYPALGGVVYIKNDAGYEVALLHLAKDGLAELGPIQRGDPIGKVYIGTICDKIEPEKCTSSGTHVHYQVRRNGANVDMKDNLGKCSDGFLFPANLAPVLHTAPMPAAGPFTCD